MIFASTPSRVNIVASPQLEEGFIRYAHDLDAAIAVGEFQRVQRLILRIVTGQLFGFHRAKTASIDVKTIANDYGIAKQSLHRAISGLLESNVLIATNDRPRRYCLVKDYELWTVNGKPRIEPSMLAFCRDAKRLSLLSDLVNNVVDSNPPLQLSVVNNGDDSKSTTVMTILHPSVVNNGVDQLVNNVVDYHPMSPEKGREYGGEGFTHTHAPDRPSAHTREAEHQPTQQPLTLDKLYAWFAEVVPNDIEDVAGKLRGWVATYPIDHVQDALVCAVASKRSNIASYTAGILRTWKAEPERRIKQLADIASQPRAESTTPTTPRLTPAQQRDRDHTEAILENLRRRHGGGKS